MKNPTFFLFKNRKNGKNIKTKPKVVHRGEYERRNA
jgi:hypothetical protein